MRCRLSHSWLPSRLSIRDGCPMQAAETTPRLNGSTWCAPNREICEERQGAKGETIMSTGPKGTEQDSIAQCSVCGRNEALFELPGRTEKCCLECSADLATAILLSTEIDAATLSGRSTNALVSEFSEISSRMLERSQSA
jgi:hypothetical protein